MYAYISRIHKVGMHSNKNLHGSKKYPILQLSSKLKLSTYQRKDMHGGIPMFFSKACLQK